MSSLEALHGPFLIGNLLNYALMGVLTVQVYFYSLAFAKDRLALKALGLIFCLDLVQTCLSTHLAWTFLITDTSRALNFGHAIWSMTALLPMAGLVPFIVQCFFAWRIFVLGARQRVATLVVGAILFIGLASFALSLCYAVTSNKAFIPAHNTYLSSQVVQLSSLMGWLASSIACDLLITVTLAVQLRTRRNEGFQYINRVLHRTMRMAIETGALTCCAVVIELVLYLTSYSTYWFILVIVSGKIYSNSFLASLNARAPMIRMEDSSDEVIWKADDVELVFRKTFGATSTVGAVRSET